MAKRLRVVACLAVLLSSVQCAHRPMESPNPDGKPIDPRLSLTSFIESGKLVDLIVGIRPAYNRKNAPYVPIEVAIVNKGLERLTVHPESFTLVTAGGERLPVVDGDELAREYRQVDVDRRLTELQDIAGTKYASYESIRSNFTKSIEQPVVIKPLHLSRFGFSVDLIYFPRPASGVRGEVFELEVNTPELEDPVFVRFQVSGKAD